MLSADTPRPVLAMRDENATGSRRFNKKSGLQSNNGDMASTKTPAATKTRRALGDISNRKLNLNSSSKTSAANTIPKPVTTAKQPTVKKRSSPIKNIKVYANPTARKVVPLRFDDDDDIERPAGRTWAEQNHEDSFDSTDSLDADSSRIHWDEFFQKMDRIHMERKVQEEAQRLKELDEYVQRVLDLNGTFVWIASCSSLYCDS